MKQGTFSVHTELNAPQSHRYNVIIMLLQTTKYKVKTYTLIFHWLAISFF
jgi:hypothetical protein